MNFFKNNKGWPCVDLGEIATLQRGYDLPVKKRTEGAYIVYAANGPHGTHCEKKVKGPGVITGRSGTIGKVHFSKNCFWPLNTSLYVKNFHGNDPRWVFYMLQNFRLERFSQGAGVPTLNRNLVHGIKIPLPPLPEQKYIVAILDKADTIRRKRQQAIKLADDFLCATFLDMFGDPVTNPKGWEVKPLSVVCNKVTDGTHDTPKRLNSGQVFITGKHIKPFFVDFKNCDYVSDIDHIAIIKRCDPEQGDVLYTNIGANVGTAAMNPKREMFSMKNVALLKPNKETILSRYLEYTLNHVGMKKKILGSTSVGGAQQFLSLTHIRQIEVPIPSLLVQKKFENFLYQSSQLLKQQNLLSLEKNLLFNSLTQRAFRGEL